MISTPILLSWSGGKDSAWALHVLRESSAWNVVALLTTVTSGYQRIAMHGIRREILHAQADAVGLPVLEASIAPHCDNADYEAAFADTLATARNAWPALQDIAFGDLFLADVRAYREALCARLGWLPQFPLWMNDTKELAGKMIAGGLRARLCCVDTQQLNGEFSGRPFDADLLAALPANVDPCGERGEFHTCVSDGPMFLRPLDIAVGAKVLREDRFAYTDLVLVE
jgi:uncharacterized protein (TIGR00290 family)